ncbi:MAG: acyltransferase [Patescibacteria group bacterium]
MKRLDEIDDIRGISMIVMILIHTNAYYLSSKVAFYTLELSQFAVVAFIFCSSYLYFQVSHPCSLNWFVSYMIKRLKRLLIPYYIFFVFYTVFLILQNPDKITREYFVKNIVLTGGIEFNWLVLLFIYLTILMPVFEILKNRYRLLLYIYTAIAFASSILFLKYTPLSYYRYIMWLPWSLVVIYTLYFDKIKNNSMYLVVWTGVFFLMFIVTRNLILIPLDHPVRMYSNKYPPNIYHLAYSLMCVNVLYLLIKYKVFVGLKPFVHFFSRNSYSLYFIHILVIYVFRSFVSIEFGWVGFFAVILAVTSIIQLVLNLIGNKITQHAIIVPEKK